MAIFAEAISNLFGVKNPGPGLVFLLSFIGAAIWSAIMLTLIAFSLVWFKRKWNARLGDRIAVNRVGPFGLSILVADALKLLGKEIVIPDDVDRFAYKFAPVISVAPIILAFGFVPWGNGLQVSDPEAGLVLMFALVSIPAIGITMGGYGANNKYTFLGFEREVAQTIAYEIPLVIGAAAVIPLVGYFTDGGSALQLSNIVAAQQGPLYGIEGFPIPNWFIFAQPFAAILVFISFLAEFARNPFDLPEAGSELVAGYLTEYGGANFMLMFLAEFAHIYIGAAIFTTLFLGGGAGIILPSAVWFIIKVFLIYVFVQWLRGTIPRVRIDQLLAIGWKRLLELTFLNLLFTTAVIWVI
ncbi:MAG: NADH-quinone oxidoreductase subunit H [Halobacteria archaeon]